MSHAIHRVRGFEVIAPYTLRIEFEDGVSRTIDFKLVLQGDLYGPLRDRAMFDGVRIDPMQNRWWQLKINGTSKNASPHKSHLKAGDVMHWIYFEDKQ